MQNDISLLIARLLLHIPSPAFVIDNVGTLILKNDRADGMLEKESKPSYFIDKNTVNIDFINRRLNSPSNNNEFQIESFQLGDEKYYLLVIAQINDVEENNMLNFVGDLSHELRTPLNGIIGFAEIIQKKALSVEKTREYASIIYSNGIFMQQLINDMIDFARIELGHFVLRKTYFSINRLIYDLMVLFVSDMQNKHKHDVLLLFENGLPDGKDMIVADEVRLKQVLINLISNAIKFTQKGNITIGYILENQILHFYVRDTGIGIEEGALENIFKRYVQANRKIINTYGGSGLGLSIAKDIIELHGGKIWAESKLNEGTTFNFTIPYEAKK
jgi:signal transduction histidine kinase